MFVRRMLVIFLSCVFCFGVFADDKCPIGYGYQAPATFFGNNLNNASTTSGGITAGGEQVSDSHYRTNNFTEIPVEIGKSYTFVTSEPDAGKYIASYDANHNFIERVIVSDDTYACPNGVAYVITILYVDNENKWKQSESDTQIFLLDTPLYKVGEYADEIDWQNQQIIRRVGVKVFDGTENWNYGGNNTGYGFYYKISDCKTERKAPTDIICTHLPTRTQSGGYSQNPSIGYFTATDNNITVRYDDFLDGDHTAMWSSYLAEQHANGTPVIVYYPLATPVVEEISDSEYAEYQMPVINGYCSLCPPNTYKDFVGNSACTPCPNRTISLSGSASVNDCGHILRVGNFITFMPVGRRTEHGLCAMLDGKKYCADVYERK